VSGIVEHVEEFFTADEGRHRLTFDSLTELAYYADEDRALDVAKRLVDLIKTHDAVGLFHLSSEVHDEETVAEFVELFDGTVRLDDDGNVSYEADE